MTRMERRNRINAIISKLEEINEEISSIRDEEQDAFDSMPEGLQSSERGETMQNAITNLEYADLQDLIGYLDNAIND